MIRIRDQLQNTMAKTVLAILTILLLAGVASADTTAPTINWEPPTPSDGATVSNNYVELNTTITDESVTSALFDWNHSVAGYWNFESTNSSGVFDNSSYNNFGSFDGGLSESDTVVSPWGEGIDFDGQDDYVDLGTGVDVQGWSEFSVAAWAKIDDVTDDEYSDIIHIQAYSIRLAKSGGGNWLIFYYDGTDPHVDDIDASGDSGDWIHLVGVFDGEELELYRNGVGSGHPESTTNDVRDDRSGEKSAIGSRYDGNNHFFDGKIDEVVIMSRAISQDEVQALYNNSEHRLKSNITDLSNGTYDYKAFAIDENGNFADGDDRTVTVDTSIPCKHEVCVKETGYWLDNNTFQSTAHPLRDGYSNATAGDTIYVNPGTYEENLTLNKNTRFLGNGSYDEVLIEGEMNYSASITWENVTVGYIYSPTYDSGAIIKWECSEDGSILTRLHKYNPFISGGVGVN